MRAEVAAGRRLPVGAEPAAGRGTHFRVWAPLARRVELVLEDEDGRERSRSALAPEPGGYHSGWEESAAPGALYRFRLDGEGPFPDPASRFQPRGPHGPSEVVDPGAFAWTDGRWRGARLEGQVLYELHAGTFTPEGTWEAAARELPRLSRLGVTTVELMPVADFPGRFGWGYDGVDLYAPTRLYGRPDDLRRFVDRAHAAGLAVILDVVYNHFGPDGNYLGKFGPYQQGRPTEWGPAVNYDGKDAAGVREFVASNAAYWISEYRLDGLRLDATQCVFDDSPDHVLAELTRAARAAAGSRSIVVFAENETQEARLVRLPDAGGLGLDAIWNDDFHHSAFVALTGRREAYYEGYGGTAQELVSCALRGFLFQGQWYGWQKKGRGRPALDVPAPRFVHFLENHDQVSNSLDGRRLRDWASLDRLRALTALLLLAPQTPLLFQGQEFGSRAPFLFFADHEGGLGEAVRKGRLEYIRQFPGAASPGSERFAPPPGDPATFERCRLAAEGRESGPAFLLHRDLLALRREDPVFRAQRGERVDGAVLGRQAFALRFLGDLGEERLLVVNLAEEAAPDGVEPLLAPPEGGRWELAWSSEDPLYGGAGARSPVDERGAWRLPAGCASVLRSRPV